MFKKALAFFIIVLTVGFSSVGAQENNKFGMHLAVPDENELRQVAELVNSSGGDWGYVTVVIQENDLNKQKWQDVFNRMRELHLIPIVRVATQPQTGGFWRCPEEPDIDKWVDFLDSLNWVIKNRYVVLFNEPNHGAEWGGGVDPEGFAKIVNQFSRKLKERNENFYVMMAGLDSAAPNQPPAYMDEYEYLRRMHFSVEGGLPELFKSLDGWASHSYPNHGYVGSPYDTGRNSILNYRWELQVLRNFGVRKDLPVFITETGWPHFEGFAGQTGYYSAEQVAKNYQAYFRRILPDERVVAITPFIFNYQGEPFDHFSWRKPNSEEFYPQYETVLGISKTAGEPDQEHILKIDSLPPSKLIHNSTYRFYFEITNQGQAIWSNDDGYKLGLSKSDSAAAGGLEEFEYFFSDLPEIAPFQTKEVSLSLKTADRIKNYDLRVMIYKEGEAVSNPVDWNIDVRPNIDLEVSVQPLLWWGAKGKSLKFLIYDSNQQVVLHREGLSLIDARLTLEQIDNVALGEEYRLVLIKPGSLPRQTYLTFQEPGLNKAEFKFLIPVDFNHDGNFSWQDFIVPFQHLRMKF